MQYKDLQPTVLLCPLQTLLVHSCCVSVCICMCWCVCRTDCTPPHCSQWPPQPSAQCIALFLPSVQEKKIYCPGSRAFLWLGLWFHSREMMKMQPTLLSFSVCICLCESLRLHLPGSCSQLTENCSPHTHRASPRSLITHSWQFRVCMSCEKTLPASVLEFWRSFWGHQHRLFSLSFFPPCILCFFPLEWLWK